MLLRDCFVRLHIYALGVITEFMQNVTYPKVFAKGITKSFGKNIHALRGVSLAVFPGSVVAILGPNGAGKTTLIRILTTLLQPTTVMAIIDGFDVTKFRKNLFDFRANFW